MIDRIENEKYFHILALSGGGFKGLFTANIIDKIEQKIGCPIAKNLICLLGRPSVELSLML